MPNHVTTILEIKDLGDSSLEQVRASMMDDKGFIDFEVICPLPECLKDFNPHHGILTAAKAKLELPISGNVLIASLELPNRIKAEEEFEAMSDEDKALVQRAMDNYKECGYMYWYDFNNAHWGTKWNAYGQPEEGHPQNAQSFKFDTAWSHPTKMVSAISKKVPTVEFSIKFADEDTGSNCGSYTLINGETSNEDIAPRWSEQTEEQKLKYREFAFNVRYPGKDPRAHGYDENWEWSEEIETEYYESQKEKSETE